jgi:hypothetical protein
LPASSGNYWIFRRFALIIRSFKTFLPASAPDRDETFFYAEANFRDFRLIRAAAMRKSQFSLAFFAFLLGLVLSFQARAATQVDIHGPAFSNVFGLNVYVLPNGNFVVTDPLLDAGATASVGAVYLYHGATLALISTLHGTRANDQIGAGGVVVLTNGNYVVRSPDWDNGAISDAGAVTWCSGTAGCGGAVDAANSLVGGAAGDRIGGAGVARLSNGNYVAASPHWDNGAVIDAGAATWGNGSSGTTGIVSTGNSLVGDKSGDMVGAGGVVSLTNGNYAVGSPNWRSGAASNAGAATWGDGAGGTTGTISAANSLTGGAGGDMVSGGGITALPNGDYVVSSPNWANGAALNAGAVSWGSGAGGSAGLVSAGNSLVGGATNDSVGNSGVTVLANSTYVIKSPNWDNAGIVDAGAATWSRSDGGTTGLVAAGNSLVGGSSGDMVGAGGVTALTNGGYVVATPGWDDGAIVDAGAATWGSGVVADTGTITPTNSITGSTSNDMVGSGGVTALTNGNYVVVAPGWSDGATAKVGAARWGSGAGGSIGPISASNALIGTTTNDGVGGSGVIALTNGNYVVASQSWDNGGIVDAGAVTWGNGAGGMTGIVSTGNSLVGGTTNDFVGNVTALTNGNYAVRSPNWDNGTIIDAGAATWGSGAGGSVGLVSAGNSLVGGAANDLVGSFNLIALANGNYVVNSPSWDNGAAIDAGAVTWGNGAGGTTGLVSAGNSLVGGAAGDTVASGGIVALANGGYLAISPNWDNAAITNAGAVTLGNGAGATVGLITADNSVRGEGLASGFSLSLAYNPVFNKLIVGRFSENIVSVLMPTGTSAASVAVAGRVLDAGGRGVGNASVTITAPAGEPQAALTNAFGYFRFESIRAGETYLVSIRSKRFQFAPQIVTVNEELTGLVFDALKE